LTNHCGLRKRGIHNIDDEITYPNNPGFVFHDSGGFEAGSDVELKAVRSFMKFRSRASALAKQLHAIWFCLPVDDDRPFPEAEMAFFMQGTGLVPVIAIFTECDAQEIKAVNQLCQAGRNRRQAYQEAPSQVNAYLQGLETKLKKTDNPPSAFVRLKDMNKPEAQCQELVDRTAASIGCDILQLLFVSVQQVNLKTCIK
jgi:hypothetical protein